MQDRFSDVVADRGFDYLVRVVAPHVSGEIRIRLDSDYPTPDFLERLGNVAPGCPHIEGKLARAYELREECARLLALPPYLSIDRELVRVPGELISRLHFARGV